MHVVCWELPLKAESLLTRTGVFNVFPPILPHPLSQVQKITDRQPPASQIRHKIARFDLPLILCNYRTRGGSGDSHCSRLQFKPKLTPLAAEQTAEGNNTCQKVSYLEERSMVRLLPSSHHDRLFLVEVMI